MTVASPIDLAPPATGDRAPWRDPATWWPALTDATRHLDPPLAVLSRDALAHNAHDLLRRAAGLPIRVASKSIRVRAVLDSLLELPGYRGILAFTLPEAIWLAEDFDDVVVAYPSVDRGAYRALVADPRAAARVTVMIDDVAQLDLIDAVVAPSQRPSIRVAIELDASYRHPLLGHVGVRRSPIRTPDQAEALARAVTGRPGFTLVGMMAYEAQIAGVGDAGKPVIRAMQRASAAELSDRRSEAVARVRAVTPLEFVNGGGTGSIESTHADDSVTEVAAGSGLFGPHLFDHYSAFSPAPAAAFALSVVRRPAPDTVTLLGGGWIASGPPGADRTPLVVWPEGLHMLPREGAGEVQTPLRGEAARPLAIGDRVWLRHTKAGELSEHVAGFAIVADGDVVGQVPTYRGEGRVFL